MIEAARRHPRIARVSIPAAIAVMVLLLAGCTEDDARDASRRVLLIGVDGASPRIVEPLLAKGRLPNLAALARRGVHGTLRSELPLYSPRIWNTIVTGRSPEEHGIDSFFYAGMDGKDHLYTSADRRTPALWTIADRAGLRVGVVNFWNTHPPEKVDGVMVSDHVLAEEVEGLRRMTGAVGEMDFQRVVHPPEWGTRLSRALRERPTPVPEIESPFAEPRALPDWVDRNGLQRRFAEDAALARMAEEILENERPDVMLVLLPGVDRISHFIWGVVEPAEDYPPSLTPTSEARAGGREALFEYYAYVDALVGVLSRHFGPDDLVLVLSDHGFEGGQAMLNLTGVHESHAAQDGILFAAGAGISAGAAVRDVSIDDITPTILAWLGLPVGRGMAGRIASFVQIGETPAPVDYDSLEVELVEPRPEGSGVEAELVEQLKALGYTGE